MQADRRLVEDVEDADQRRSDLGRQPDPLGLAAGERGGRAVEREVADPDVLEEPQPLLDLAKDQPRDVPLGLGQRDLVEPAPRLAHRERGELVDRHPADEDGARFRPQARALARRARHDRHELLDALAHRVGVRLAEPALEVRDDPLEAGGVGALAPVAVLVGDEDALPTGPVEEQRAMLRRQVLPGRVEVDVVLLGQREGDLPVVLRGARRPRCQRALADRERRIGNDELRVDLHLRAEARAALACAVRRVEREDPRLELRHRRAALQAGELLGERQDLRGLLVPLARDELDLDDAVRQADRGLDRVGEPLAQVGAHHEPVDDDRDVVLELLVELDRLVQLAQLAVDLRPREAVRAELLEELAVLALATADDRGEHHEPRALVELHHLIDDLLGRLPGDRRPAVRAVRVADARPEQAQVVVDLRDRADRRPRVARGRLLVDRDRRRQPLDRVHVRLVHLPEELARVGAERLDVAALALGVDRVEGERRLPRPGQAGYDHQRVARQLEGDVLQIVFTRAGDDDRVGGRHPDRCYKSEQTFACLEQPLTRQECHLVAGDARRKLTEEDVEVVGVVALELTRAARAGRAARPPACGR